MKSGKLIFPKLVIPVEPGPNAGHYGIEMNAESACPMKRNVGDLERLFCAGFGGWWFIKGLFSRRAFPTALGAMLVYRGLTGTCKGYEVLGIDTANPTGLETTSGKES